MSGMTFFTRIGGDSYVDHHLWQRRIKTDCVTTLPLSLTLVYTLMRIYPMSDEVFLYLTTTGWKSGRDHTIEIWFVEYEGCAYLVAEKREQAHWVQNIRQQSSIRYRIGHNTADQPGTGSVIDPAREPELAAAIRRLMDDKYGWSDGLIVQLCRD